MAKYKIEIFSKEGRALGDISALVQNLNWTKTRNEAESVDFEINLFQLEKYLETIGFEKNPFEFIEAGRTDLRIYRNGRAILGANISKLDYSIGSGGATVKVSALGYLNFYKSIYHDISFTNTPQHEIIWGVIEQINAKAGGDYGIRRGAHIGKTVRRDRNFTRKEVKSFIQQLSEVIDGVDFEFTPDKKLNTYESIGIYRPEVRLEFPKNIESVDFSRSIGSTYNFIYGIGSGNGEDAVQAQVSDSLSIGEYYRREKVVNFNSVQEETTLRENINAVLNASKNIFELPSVKVGDGVLNLNEVSVGDTIWLSLGKYASIKHIQGYYRIEQIAVSVDNNGAESVSLTFDGLDIEKIISGQEQNE